VEAPPFVLFGLDHIAAILITGVVAAGLSLAVRPNPNSPLGRAVRIGFAGIVAAAIAYGMIRDGLRGRLSAWDWVPLNLCDFEIVLAVFALLTRRQAAYEIFYFWALAGTLIAMITPEITRGFPSRQFLSFFAFHGAVVTAALFMTWGLKMRPRAGAHWRVFLWTNVYAAVAAAANLTLKKNFLYLCEKPQGFSVLDWFGPWPVYIAAAEVLALTLFALLSLPFRGPRPTRTRS